MAIADRLDKLKSDLVDTYNALDEDALVDVESKNTNNLPRSNKFSDRNIQKLYTKSYKH